MFSLIVVLTSQPFVTMETVSIYLFVRLHNFLIKYKFSMIKLGITELFCIRKIYILKNNI